MLARARLRGVRSLVMPGAPRDPPGSDRDLKAVSRRLTPSMGIDLDEPQVPSDTSNEDFLFHLYRGSELLQDNRVHEAKEELERALVMQPRDAKGQDLLAIVYFRLGLYPRAIAIYEQLRRASPRDPALMLNLALCYLKTGQPSFARHELADLVKHHPSHARGWGYLGLACERLGDLDAARDAFERGGHVQLARRMEARIAGRSAGSLPPAQGAEEAEARSAVAAAFEELDAGELSFALAEPASDTSAPASWQSVELGQREGAPSSLLPRTVVPLSPESRPALPHLAAPAGASRRPTLIAPAPPLGEADIPQIIAPPSLAMPPPSALAAEAPQAPRRNTAPLPAVSQLARDSVVAFPASGEVALHATGIALVRTGSAGFHVRPEAVRVAGTSMKAEIVLRRTNGRATSTPLGGLASPIALFRGDGQLVVGARPGRKLTSFLLEGELAFVREDALLGFDGRLQHEAGRLDGAGEEPLAMVQLEGGGAVLLEGTGELLGLEVKPETGLLVRREAVVAWFGRLVPRMVPPAEAPGGQRGLVAFGGEGSVLFATA